MDEENKDSQSSEVPTLRKSSMNRDLIDPDDKSQNSYGLPIQGNNLLSDKDFAHSEDISPKPHIMPTQNAMIKPCQCGKPDCPSCGSEGSKMSPQSFVYAIGKVVHRFPNKSVEMELAQAIGRIPTGETKSLTHPELVHKTLIDPYNRYISRQMCYVFTIGGLETYILFTSDPLDNDKLSQAIRSEPDPTNLEIIIGRKGRIAPPEMCNGLMVPIVIVDQMYSFDRDTLIKSIPKQKGVNESQYRKSASAIFDNILQIADNTGAIDEHRAINYLAVRYDEIYHRTQLLEQQNYSFTGVEVRPSSVSDIRKVLDVIFSYEDRKNRAIQKWFARVDVTEEFPFLVTPFREYFER